MHQNYMSRTRRAPLWGGDPARYLETEAVLAEMPPGHIDSVGYSVQCRHTRGDWRAANQRATETEELQRFGHLQRMPDHRPQKPAETERKEEKARRDLLELGECHQQKPS